jgi:hypothetical protein
LAQSVSNLNRNSSSSTEYNQCHMSLAESYATSACRSSTATACNSHPPPPRVALLPLEHVTLGLQCHSQRLLHETHSVGVVSRQPIVKQAVEWAANKLSMSAAAAAAAATTTAAGIVRLLQLDLQVTLWMQLVQVVCALYD